MQHYEILGVIGQGQYGVAHKVAYKGDNKLYCMKRIPMSKEEDAKGAMQEAHLLSSLNHPNVLGYKESFLHDGSLCIITHFCEEGDLFGLIRRRAKAKQYFSENEVVNMFLQIAMGLQHIHTKKILHRDLKTQNIFVAKGGILKLGDFGICKVLEKTDDFTSTVTGTPYYMAPEICKNEPYSLKSDIWSLGCVLYELCTLKHAFAADSLLSLVYQIVKGNFPPIPQDQFSPGLSQLVTALLHKDTDCRPTLKQVFMMPYVEAHKQQFHKTQGRLNRTGHGEAPLGRTRSKGRSPDNPSGPGSRAAGYHANPALRAAQNADRQNLTPREKMRLKKQQQADQRALELKVASINMNVDRQSIKSRKSQMLGGTTIGGAAPRPASASRRPGSSAGGHPGDYSPYGDTGTVLMGSVAEEASDAFSQAARRGYGTYYAEDDDVNLASMNPQGYGDGPYEPSGASVLMGSIQADAGQERPCSSNANFQYGIDMRKPSTPLSFGNSLNPHDEVPAVSSAQRSRLGGGQGQQPGRPGTVPAHMGGGHPPDHHHQQQQQQQPARPSTGVVEVNGFRFGVDPSVGASSSDPWAPQRANQPATPEPQDRQNPQHARTSPAVQTRRHDFSSDSEDDIDDEFSDSGDDYSDDFEDYSDDFESDDDEEQEAGKGRPGNQSREITTPGTPQVKSERKEMMRNLRNIDNGMSTAPSTNLEEMVPSQVRNNKMDQLRERCRDALGRDFEEVYKYLRHARQSYGYEDDERIKNELIEMVGRRKLAACFECDQLVFQELLQSDY